MDNDDCRSSWFLIVGRIKTSRWESVTVCPDPYIYGVEVVGVHPIETPCVRHDWKSPKIVLIQGQRVSPLTEPLRKKIKRWAKWSQKNLIKVLFDKSEPKNRVRRRPLGLTQYPSWEDGGVGDYPDSEGSDFVSKDLWKGTDLRFRPSKRLEKDPEKFRRKGTKVLRVSERGL